MGYISDGTTIWKEHCSTSDKLTGLNKLEGMYGEAVGYIDSILHAERYYDKSETAAKYFTSANDGTDSLLVCETLDGYTAAQIVAAGTPSGCIVVWSGSIANIPTGFVLCNGANDTPDLRNRMVICTGTTYASGTTGGSATITTSGSVTIGNHALTAAEIPLHTHDGIQDYFPGYTPDGPTGSGSSHYCNQTINHDVYTGYAGSGTAHGHTGSFTGTSGQSKMPLYYALAFIMRV